MVISLSLSQKRLLLICTTMLILSLGCDHSSSSFEITPPASVLKDIETGSTTESVFQIRNTGLDPILSLTAEADCHCTIPSPLPAQLNGEATAEFSIRFTAPSQPGSFQHIVLIKSENEQQAVSIIGNATKTIETSPHFLTISISPGVNTFSRTFEIRALNQKKIAASEVKITPFVTKGEREEPGKTIPGINLVLFSHPDNPSILQGIFQASRNELNLEKPLHGEIAIRLRMEDDTRHDVRIQFLVSEKPAAVVQPSLVNGRYDLSSHCYEVDPLRIISTKPVTIEEISLRASQEKVLFEKYSHAMPGLNYFEQVIRASIPSESGGLNLKYTTLVIKTDSHGYLNIPIIFVDNKTVEKGNSVVK